MWEHFMFAIVVVVVNQLTLSGAQDCDNVIISGRRGVNDFINGEYQAFSTINGRPSYRSNHKVPADHHNSGEYIYIYWFKSRLEQDWSISSDLGSNDGVYAFASEDKADEPQDVTVSWSVPVSENEGERTFNPDAEIQATCAQPVTISPILQFDLAGATDPRHNQLFVLATGKIELQCNTVPGQASQDYMVVLGTEEAFELCDVASSDKFLAVVGECNGADPGSTITIDLRTDSTDASENVGVAEARRIFVISVTQGSSQLYGISGQPGAGGLCETHHYKAAVSVIPDFQSPSFTNCPTEPLADVTEPGAATRTVSWDPLEASDNSGYVEVAAASALKNGDSFRTGTTTVTYVATDATGNSAECAITVTIVDEETPMFGFCPSRPVEAFAAAGVQFVQAFWSTIVATDNVAMNEITSTHSPGSWFPVGETIVRYAAEDTSQNSETCEFSVVVKSGIKVQKQSPTEIKLKYGSTLTLFLEVSGTSPITYKWTKDGLIEQEGQDSYYTVDFATPAISGVYFVSADNGVALVSEFFRVEVNPPSVEDEPKPGYVYITSTATIAQVTAATFEQHQTVFCDEVLSSLNGLATDCTVLNVDDTNPIELLFRVEGLSAKEVPLQASLEQVITNDTLAEQLSIAQPSVFVARSISVSSSFITTSEDRCSTCTTLGTCLQPDGVCTDSECLFLPVPDATDCTAVGGADGFCFGGSCISKTQARDCIVSAWSQWILLENPTKGPATLTRSRNKTFDAVNGGAPCPELKQTATCSDPPSDEDAKSVCDTVTNESNIDPEDDEDPFYLTIWFIGACAGFLLVVACILSLAALRKRRQRSPSPYNIHYIAEKGDEINKIGRKDSNRSIQSANSDSSAYSLDGLAFQMDQEIAARPVGRSASRENLQFVNGDGDLVNVYDDQISLNSAELCMYARSPSRQSRGSTRSRGSYRGDDRSNSRTPSTRPQSTCSMTSIGSFIIETAEGVYEVDAETGEDRTYTPTVIQVGYEMSQM